MYFMKCEQVGSLSLMIFNHDYYIYVHYEKPPIFNPILAGLDIGNNMSDSLCKRKEKKILIFHIFLYLDSYSKCRKNDLHLKKIADEDRISQMIDLSQKNRGGWRGGGFSFAEVRTRLTQVEVPVVWLGNSRRLVIS